MLEEPTGGRVGIPSPRRPEQQAWWGQSGYRDLVVALLPVNDYSIAEVESVLVAISGQVTTSVEGNDPGGGEHGGVRAPARVCVRTVGGAFSCTPGQLYAVAAGGQVSSVSVNWTYRDGSQLRGQLIAEGHRGRLLAEPASMAHAAAAEALERMQQLRPGRGRWLTWMSRWLLPTTCVSVMATFTYLAWGGLQAMRAQAEAAAGSTVSIADTATSTPTLTSTSTVTVPGEAQEAMGALRASGAGMEAAHAGGEPWLAALVALATALFLFAVVLAVIAPARRYGGTRMRPGSPPLWSTAAPKDSATADAPATALDLWRGLGTGVHLPAGPGAALGRCVQHWPEVVVLACAFTACASVAAVAVLLLA